MRSVRGVRDLVWSLVGTYAAVNRRRKAAIICDVARRHDLATVLLVGAAVTGNPQDGIVELALDRQMEVVSACNIEPLPLPWPSVVGDARCLPYKSSAVDMVVSNAVIEHVGDATDQRAFIKEHDRVGHVWVITTPNRTFPIEPHTATLIRHYSRAWRDRQDDFTRMLTKREFRALLPPEARIVGHWWSPTLIAIGGESRRASAVGDPRTAATRLAPTGR
jgi:hypothetical protein